MMSTNVVGGGEVVRLKQVAHVSCERSMLKPGNQIGIAILFCAFSDSLGSVSVSHSSRGIQQVPIIHKTCRGQAIRLIAATLLPSEVQTQMRPLLFCRKVLSWSRTPFPVGPEDAAFDYLR